MAAINTRVIARTAVLLAICIIAQQFKGISQFITGPIVNMTMIIAVLSSGGWSGAVIAVISPIMVYITGVSPIFKIVPQMIIVVMGGNLIITLLVALLKDKKLILGLIAGSCLKALFLWWMVQWIVIPFFGGGLNDMQKNMMSIMFSYNQLITAATGSLLAYLLWGRLKILNNTHV